MEIRHLQSFSELIKAIRLESSLSQRALAKVLEVSSGYVGQWELGMSQPSVEVMLRLCARFGVEDIEYVQRLAYAQRAPEWLRESIIHYQREYGEALTLSVDERRALEAMRRLGGEDAARLVERMEGWVDAVVDTHQG